MPLVPQAVIDIIEQQSALQERVTQTYIERAKDVAIAVSLGERVAHQVNPEGGIQLLLVRGNSAMELPDYGPLGEPARIIPIAVIPNGKRPLRQN